jgi:ParB-like chromosome segregation protein Spo0J
LPELALTENLQRGHLHPFEIAVGYERLVEKCNCTPDDIGKKTVEDGTSGASFIRGLKLPLEYGRA